MTFLEVDGARLAYRSVGSGPPLLAPECNYTWQPDVEALMAEHFTLIVGTPRDFGTSTRTGGPYDPARWAEDLYSIARHLGHDRFLVFGYSFTGVLGPWLARRLRDRAAVVAVASGGFPLLGDYAITARGVDEQLTLARNDPALWAMFDERFDPVAGRDFYRDLATLAPDTLADDVPCPLYCFWGDHDTDAIGYVLPQEDYAAGLQRRGVPFDVYAGYDHEALNNELTTAWPAAEAWLLERAAEAGLEG